MKKPIRVALFASALAPAMVILSIKHLFQPDPPSEAVYWLVGGALALILPLLIIRALLQRAEVLPVAVKKVESLEWPMFVAAVGYMIPLVGMTFDQLTLILVLAIAALAALDSIPFHPVLHLFRFRFYKAELAGGVVYWLITRRRVLDASSITKVREVAPGLIMEER